jgi:hypothetical protein
MAYDILHLQVGVWPEERTHGTGTGTLYVHTLKSADGVVDLVRVIAAAAPSTTDSFAIGSEWTNITAGSVKKYIKTADATWTVIGSQS